MDSWFTPFDEHADSPEQDSPEQVGTATSADADRREGPVEHADHDAPADHSAGSPGRLIEVPAERWGRPDAGSQRDRAGDDSAPVTPLLRLPIDRDSDAPADAADADESVAAPRGEPAVELAEVRGELFERVLRALRHRQRSRSEIERHMRELIAASDELELSPAQEESLVASIIDDLERLGYLNDEHLAEAVVRSSLERKKLGASAIRRELRQRGIDEAAAAAALDELVDDESEAERALEVARERASKQSGLDPEALKRRLYGYLQRRGFSGPALTEAVSVAVREATGAGLGRGLGSKGVRRPTVRFDDEG